MIIVLFLILLLSCLFALVLAKASLWGIVHVLVSEARRTGATTSSLQTIPLALE